MSDTTTRCIRAPFYYYGGKGKLKKQIISLIPEHTRYVEVFGGAGNVILAKPEVSFEVFNDLANEIYAFFACLQDEAECQKFEQMLSVTCFSRTLFEEWKNRANDSLGSLHEKAYRTFIIANMTHGGKLHNVIPSDFRVGFISSPAHQMQSKIAATGAVIKRFKNVILENKPFEWVIRKYDRVDVFMYLDPPYLKDIRVKSKRTTYGAYEMTVAEHENLIGLLKTCKSKCMVSGYDNALYNSLGWRKELLVTRCSMDFETAGGTKPEVVWMNY